MPALPIYKGIPGPTLLAELLLNKYEYYLPFYRQVKMLNHMGMHVKDNTVNGWFAPAASLLTPLYDALLEEILKSDYVQSDETTVPVVDHDKKKAVKEWLWGLRAVVERLVLFHYDNGSRGGKVIGEKAKGYKGYMQCDGYAGYGTAFKANPDVRLVACMAHNLMENAIRPIALGRKNYLFCGSHEGAGNMAVVCSLVATCKVQEVNPRDYLNDIIEKMPRMKDATREELVGLLPHKWKMQHCTD